jgi:succinate dehydrogenase (ubiquinone) iron-sulfur subunit
MQAYRWIIDSRDQYTEERLEKISGQKLERCYQIGACSLTCPKGKFKIKLGLDPRYAIEKLKDIYSDYKRQKRESINPI